MMLKKNHNKAQSECCEPALKSRAMVEISFEKVLPHRLHAVSGVGVINNHLHLTRTHLPIPYP